MKRLYFFLIEQSVVDAGILNTPPGKYLGVASLPDPKRHVVADRRIFLEIVGFNFQRLLFAVEEDLDALRFCRTVIGDKHMLPLARLEGASSRFYFDRVVGPGMNQVGGKRIAILPQIPSAEIIGLVHAGDNATRCRFGAGGHHPSPVAEGLVFLKIAQVAQVEGATRFHDCRGAEFPFRNPVDIAHRLERPLTGGRCATDLFSFSFIEWGMNDESLGEPSTGKRCLCSRGKPAVEISAGVLFVLVPFCRSGCNDIR